MSWGLPLDAPPTPRTSRPQPAETGLVVEEVTTGWVGAVVRVEKSGGQHVVVLEDRRGRHPHVPAGPGLLARRRARGADRTGARRRRPARPTRTASGSVAVPTRAPGWPAAAGSGSRASTTPSSWRRSGATTCGSRASSSSCSTASTTSPDALARLRPRARAAGRGARRPPGPPAPRRAGSPPRRSAATPAGSSSCSVTRTSTCGRPCGPSGSGSTAWPEIERGTEWKHGILRELGWPADEQADVARALAADPPPVRSYADLEPQPARPRRGAHRLRHAHDGARPTTGATGHRHVQTVRRRSGPRAAA